MKRVVLFIITFMSLQLFLVSCQSNNPRDEKENYEFYYYPKKNVYYNVEKKNFLYSLDGGKTWDSTVSASDQEPATLGEKIIVYSADYDVFKDNTAHRKLYNGRLYNITGSDITVAPAVPEATERKVQKKATAAKPKQEEEKVVKGLKKFLNKIFGHHKKQEQ